MSESLTAIDVQELIDSDPGTDLIGYTGTSREAIAYLVEHGELPSPEIEHISSEMISYPSGATQVGRRMTVDLKRPPRIMPTRQFLVELLRRHEIDLPVTPDYNPLVGARLYAQYYAARHRLNALHHQLIGAEPSNLNLSDSSRSDLIEECEIKGAGVILALGRHVSALVEPPITRVLTPDHNSPTPIFDASDEPDWPLLAHVGIRGLSLKQDTLIGTSDISSIIPVGEGDRGYLKKLVSKG